MLCRLGEQRPWALENLLADDFTFTSPVDDHIKHSSMRFDMKTGQAPTGVKPEPVSVEATF